GVLLARAQTGAPAPQRRRRPAESAGAESVPAPPPPPTLDQKRFLDGLRTATRGIAQLKDGLNRVARTQARSDSASQRRAGRFLAGVERSTPAADVGGRASLRTA